MDNFRNVALSALLGVVSVASLAAYDNYPQGSSQQGGNWGRQAGSNYQQDGNYQGQGGYYQQDGSQAQYQGQGGYYQQDGSQVQYQGQPSGYSQGSGPQGCQNQSNRPYGQQYNQRQFSPNDTRNEAVASRVLSAYQNDPTLSSVHTVQVTVYNGEVTLTGTVKNDDEKSKLETIAKQVNGVKSVSNKVTVAK